VFLLPGLHCAAAGTSIHPVHSAHKANLGQEHKWNGYTYTPTPHTQEQPLIKVQSQVISLLEAFPLFKPEQYLKVYHI
jgi:hypothetical protein